MSSIGKTHHLRCGAKDCNRRRPYWAALCKKHRAEKADELARELVCGIESLDELIDKWTEHGYRPTIDCRMGWSYRELAEAYDARAKERGIAVTCYRIGNY